MNFNHINIEKTKLELGIDVYILRPNSEKPVYRICEICRQEEIKKFRYVATLGQSKCLTCSNQKNGQDNADKISAGNKKFHSTHVHPRLGVKHTPEARQKIRDNFRPHVWTDDERKELSKKISGELNPFFGKKHTPKAISKMRAAAKKNARKGKESNFYGKSFYAKHTIYQRKTGESLRLKSSWEVKLAEFLDANNIKWEYEKQAFPLVYRYEGEIKEGTYIPDFFVGDEIWEVKGYWRKDAKVKFKAFLKKYPEKIIKVLGKKELQDLGIKLS
jgi:hypothetical protein